jgi:hypothetical protein
MDLSRIPPPSSPWPGRVIRDLELLLLSVVVAFTMWLAGSWQLAGQVSPPLHASLGTEQIMGSSLDLSGSDLAPERLSADDSTEISVPSPDLGVAPPGDS